MAFYSDESLKKFDSKLYLSSPTMHGDELKYMTRAFETNWMSTVGENINEVERIAAAYAGVKYAVGLATCTAALHLALLTQNIGPGDEVITTPLTFASTANTILHVGATPVFADIDPNTGLFCTDMTFAAAANPVVYEGGSPIFIDTDEASWNMDPRALERAFELYPDTRLVIMAHLYGFPGRIDFIRDICHKHGAILIEDAAEAMGATLGGKQCGSFGDYAAVSYNGNKIITGSSGGCLLTGSEAVANKVRKWSTQAREAAAWYQHEEVGYNYRMSNVVAGVIRGQYEYLNEHIAQKKAIYNRYKEGLSDLPVSMNPILPDSEPNYWLSAMIIDPEYMCRQVRDDENAMYIPETGKSCPTEILQAIRSVNAEGRPIWKPMHMQPIYRMSEFVTVSDSARATTDAYISGGVTDVGSDIFDRGLCLPSDNKMTEEQQAVIIDIIHRCFG